MNTQEMREELERAGYRFATAYKHPTSDKLWTFEARSRNGWIYIDNGHYEADEVDNMRMKEDVIKQAYGHYQQQKELEELRAMKNEYEALENLLKRDSKLSVSFDGTEFVLKFEIDVNWSKVWTGKTISEVFSEWQERNQK